MCRYVCSYALCKYIYLLTFYLLPKNILNFLPVANIPYGKKVQIESQTFQTSALEKRFGLTESAIYIGIQMKYAEGISKTKEGNYCYEHK